MKLKFKAKARQVGGSKVVTVPYSFFDSGMLNAEQEYLFIIEENNQNSEDKTSEFDTLTVSEKSLNSDTVLEIKKLSKNEVNKNEKSI